MKAPLFFYIPITLISLLLVTGCKDTKPVQQEKKEQGAVEELQTQGVLDAYNKQIIKIDDITTQQQEAQEKLLKSK